MHYRLAFFLFFFMSPCVYAQTPAYPYATNLRIDSLMKHYFKEDQPGVSVSVRFRGKTVFEKSYGLADLISKRKIEDGDDFNIGSLTKQFTAFAVMELVRMGKCSLSDSIGKYLKLPPGPASVSIESLLDHSSG